MGRKLIHDTLEKKAAARRASVLRNREKTRTVTLDKDAIDVLATYKEQLRKEFGFTPSFSQTLKYLITKANP